MIGIIDYGLGNISAFENIYRNLGIESIRINNQSLFKKINKLILPGVGAFDNAMIKLNKSGLLDDLNEYVINKGVPILGVCVGMQMMACSSEEGKEKGLGWLPSGKVVKFKDNYFDMKTHTPHMGWNSICIKSNDKIFNDLNDQYFYFLHSYYLKLENYEERNILCTTKYGIEFISAIKHDNIFATQFHPEKSHISGITILKNFSML